jgi:hypothetical protein
MKENSSVIAGRIPIYILYLCHFLGIVVCLERKAALNLIHTYYSFQSETTDLFVHTN